MMDMLDWFIPADIRADRSKVGQARAMVTIFFATVLAAPLLATIQARMGIAGAIESNVFIFCSITLCIVALKTTGAFDVIRQIYVGCVFIYYSYSALTTGGIDSFNALWLIPYPLIAVFIAGRRGGVLWGGIAILAIVVFANVGPASFGLDPAKVPAGPGKDMHFYAMLGAPMVVILLAYLFESSKESGYAELDVERRNAEGLANQVGGLLGNVTVALNVVDRECEAIAGNAQRITESMVEQVRHSAGVSDTMSALHRRISDNADQSVAAAEEAGVAGQHAMQSGKVMAEAIDDMRKVSEMVQQASVKIEELTLRSDEITNIVGVIREIADQTNLLALNAAIEAARAGEQGRGFAVVADEVRKLAERTQSSTGQIGERVSHILEVTQQAMQSMKQATGLMQAGQDNAEKAEVSLNDIIQRSAKVATVLRGLAQSGQEQTKATAEMTTRVEGIRAAIDKTHASTAEIADATLRLESEISALSNTANGFNTQRS